MLIGRDPQAELCVHDEGLSWHHASLHRLGQHIFVRDLNSTNGTFLGNERISQPTLVQDGNRIGLGRRVVVKVELHDALEAAVAASERSERNEAHAKRDETGQAQRRPGQR